MLVQKAYTCLLSLLQKQPTLKLCGLLAENDFQQGLLKKENPAGKKN
jgi:hypothetical protein